VLEDLPRGLILLYHRVARLDADPYKLAITPQTFRSQMQVLADHWPAVTVSQGWERVQHRHPGAWVAITFDDAYQDVLEEAWPCLQTGQSITLFACTHEPEREFWWDRLQDPGLQPALRTSAEPEVNLPNSGRARRMGARELAWMGAQQGCEIANHTHRHLSLPCLEPARQLQEIEQAHQFLRQWSGQAVRGLAYPFGDQNEALRQRAATCCDWACGVKPGLVWKGVDPFHLPRMWVPELRGKDFYQWLSQHGLS